MYEPEHGLHADAALLPERLHSTADAADRLTPEVGRMLRYQHADRKYAGGRQGRQANLKLLRHPLYPFPGRLRKTGSPAQNLIYAGYGQPRPGGDLPNQQSVRILYGRHGYPPFPCCFG